MAAALVRDGGKVGGPGLHPVNAVVQADVRRSSTARSGDGRFLKPFKVLPGSLSSEAVPPRTREVRRLRPRRSA